MKINDYGYRRLWNVIASIGEIYKPETYLEIGVNEGGSLMSLLKHHRPKEITLCDTWQDAWGGTGKGDAEHIIELLKDIEYEGEVWFLNGYSQELVPQLKGKKTFDLILVDGNHSYRGAWLDLNNSWKILNEGGYIIFDDIRHKASMWLLECGYRFQKESGARLLHIDKEGNGVMVFQK